eukprot:Protomagalhaensia_wolfi_Nauph_80__74@NODE_1044_length_1774_cov_103_001153_g789_i0_p1_GENE_NODE_1044_length_1774_cov_103_001153_g789_i0NODE_1044_length_1774_cov_103_001153_g789_i0_p1_ORF_typecomplete_len495_score61_56Tri3/PF07428_11/4e48AATase/PF07247_12/8_6e12Condensation/PF00668_20/0_0032_NODE_1044_length_1774_cov_103_001153_g789_i02891746
MGETWSEVSAGCWERPIDEVETYYHTLIRNHQGTGRIILCIFAAVSISIEVDTKRQFDTALRKAWLKLRHIYPNIASWIEFDPIRKEGKKIYTTLMNEKDQEDWLERTFIVIDSHHSAIEWAEADPPTPHLPSLYVLRPHRTSPTVFAQDIVFRCRHDTVDGVGTLCLIDRLLQETAEALKNLDNYEIPHFQGEEHTRLSPPLKSVLNGSTCPTDAHFNVAKEWAQQWTFSGPNPKEGILSLPFNSESKGTARCAHSHLTLTKDETMAIVTACHKMGITVTHAFHTGLVMALRDTQQRGDFARAGKAARSVVADARPYCRPPYNSRAHAATVYRAGRRGWIDLVVPARGGPVEPVAQEFWRLAHDMVQFYREYLSYKDQAATIPLLWKCLTPPWLEAPPKLKAAHSGLSSLGNLNRFVESQYGSIVVDDLWITNDELTPGLSLFVSTWNQTLRLLGSYNSGWHQGDHIDKVVVRCRDIVLEALGI